jgi:RimJ/RimL family protein N-acetyltransferase
MIDFVPYLETQRLTLRGFQERDLDQYAAICADPEVMRYIGEGRPLSRAESWRQIALIIGHWSLRGYGMWAVEERASKQLIGRVGFWRPEGWPGFELGWALAREHWGKGYATEAANAALLYAARVLGEERVASYVHPDNARSIRTAERIGESLEGETMLLGHRVLVYSRPIGPPARMPGHPEGNRPRPLTSHTRVALAIARGTAAARGDRNLTPTHVAFGIFKEGQSAGLAALWYAGMSEGAIRGFSSKLESSLGNPPGFMPVRQVAIDSSPGEEEILQLSEIEVVELSDPYLGTEHILLALIRSNSAVAHMLAEHGISLQSYVDGMLAVRRGDPPPNQTPRA